MIGDLRRYLNPARAPRASEHTIKRRRVRYMSRPVDRGSAPVTVHAPPRTITLQPIVAM
jgi:hypothetical protein